jgi:hypothetical protein
MTGSVKRDDIAITALHEHRVRRVDGQAVSDHLPGEDGIGHTFQRPDLAG